MATIRVRSSQIIYLLLPQNIRFADELAVIRGKSQNDQHKITLLCLVSRKYEPTHAEENEKTSMQ